MERLTRLIVLSALALFGLNACTLPLRDQLPPALGKVIPREILPERPSAPPPVPPQPPTPTPTPPPQPAKRETQVYAYRDPSTVAAPSVPAPAAPQAAPVAVSVPSAADSSSPPPPLAPVSGDATASPAAPPPVQVATADPRSVLPSSAPQPPAPLPAPAPVATVPPSNLTMPNLPPAAGKLAAQAEQQRQAGDYAGAAATLERSLRIAPREAYLWNRLARLRLEQGQAVQAGSLAARANDLAGTQADIKRDNWRIIAEVKRRAGDFAAANAAEQRAGGG